MLRPLRLLLAEDSADDATLLLRSLRQSEFDVLVERVDSAADLSAALDSGSWDLVISDFNMPSFTGMDALRIVRERGPDMPFIFVSGTIGEETAVAAMRAGAQDYVMKGNLHRLGPAITRELSEAESRRQRRLAEERLRVTTEILQAMFGSSPLAIIITGPDGRVELWSPAAERLFGWTQDELLGEPDPTIPEPERGSPGPGKAATSGSDEKRRARSGEVIEVSASVAMAHDDAGRPSHIITLVQDQRERKRLEAQFLQAQKMEAVGQLAGGIAHDFNNLLTVIGSYCELLLEDARTGGSTQDELLQIRAAADAATSLSRQLLVLSRTTPLQPQVVPVNRVVASTSKLLKRVIGAPVELVLALDPGAGSVEVDPGQLEQVIMNLAINARDAMPDGGQLTLQTAGNNANDAMVSLVVRDTGTGMDSPTLASVFVPFFTTKAAGKGTGLGLSTVYSIVQLYNGTITVESEVGRGTTFEVRLPRVTDRPNTPPFTRTIAETLRGAETILVVEDAAAVRAVTRQVLERYGYAVLEAPDGVTGLRIAERHQGKIDLLLTDIMMPRMSGREVARLLRVQRPETRVMYVSGYTDEASNIHELHPGEVHLQKPFTPDALARTVREALRKEPPAA